MHSEVAYNSSPLMTFDLGHVLQQGNPLSLSQATVNPADLFWTQPSHVPTQAYTIPHNVPSTANNNFGGYLPGVDHAPQGASGYHPLAEVTQCVGHPLGQFTVTNEGPPMIVGPVSSGRSVMCEWVSEDGPMPVCYQTITRKTLSMHLAEHGIRNMPRNHIVQCHWQGCGAQMKRQGITRHVREVHMGLKRKSHKHAFPRQSLSSMP
ncbi:hypothetical protein EV363DRAFT_1260609 [Boletus edulis]|uniref:Uncharacterized protein n=1 Tax=Boletus edulis BED1 TaxID=1328754 RepID=A0AAD4BD40_BOLED|nr:hypothetical protein EV363DRAFT_1260609 [Boletus edulis]KAF8420744.1 hypothetical protein L210DRAFT_3574182 [Boletus edulis BED1]KAF8441300.1 hypothetical protein L210DRAFT_970152 [Boletus edulis BED1]